MDGIKLLTAASIIVKAGEQIEAMVEILDDKLVEALTDETKKIQAISSSDDTIYSTGKWILKSYLWNVALHRGNRNKLDAHVAVQIVLYDEDEAQIQGWEPSIYVMYSPDKTPFNLDVTFWLSGTSDEENEYRLDKNKRLWLWETNNKDDSWAFCIPVVKMNSEKDLVCQIVEPVKKLINSMDTATAFPEKSVAFQFIQGGDKLRILTEHKP